MNMSFLNIMLCYYFSLEVVFQGVATEIELDPEIQATLRC